MSLSFEEIFTLWNEDKKIDPHLLTSEAGKIPIVFDKYFKLYIIEKRELTRIEHDYKILYRTKVEYYMGDLSLAELTSLGWPKFQKIISKQSLPMYIDSDSVIIEALKRREDQTLKIKYIEDNIFFNLKNRGYQIKNMIDWERFTNGS
jgi:hypothetical protein